MVIGRSGRILGAVLGVVVLLAGCDDGGKSSRASGSKSTPPSTTDPAPPPPPMPASALEGLLLPAGDINTVMGGTKMEVTAPTSGMADDSDNYDPIDCTTIGGARQKRLYEGRGWLSIQGQQLREPGDMWQHYVSESVVAFNTAADAQKIFDEAHRQWSACAQRSFSWKRPSGDPIHWTTGPVDEADGIMSNTQMEEGGEGWGCQRAFTVKNNIAVDLVACTVYPKDQGVTIARKIAAKVAG